MFIEFIDQFRCTSDHEDSWLVATFVDREDRFLVRGTLGCHICLREFPVERGIAYFGRSAQQSEERDGTSHGDAEAAMRVAAFLNISERATIILAGEWARHAHEVSHILPIRIFAMNPASRITESETVVVFESNEGIPLARNTVDGIALDASTVSPRDVASALRVLKTGGRLLGPQSVSPPPEITVLASEAKFWIGEKDAEIIPLRRA